VGGWNEPCGKNEGKRWAAPRDLAQEGFEVLKILFYFKSISNSNEFKT
jgi:hypothetical protein